MSPHSISQALQSIELDISKIITWSIKNNLPINFLKTQAIAFGNKKQIRDFYQSPPSIKCGEHIINFYKSVKNLGVTFDYQLSFEEHFNKISSSTNFILYRLRYFRSYIIPSLRKRLFTALVFPHLNYCSTAIGDLKAAQYARLQKISNSGVRYINDLHIRQHITPHRYALNWLSPSYQKLYSSLCLIYKIKNIGEPHLLKDKVVFYKPPRALRIPNHELKVPASSCEQYDKSIFIYCTRQWNTLPENIRHAHSLLIFKFLLHQYLVDYERRTPVLRSRL